MLDPGEGAGRTRSFRYGRAVGDVSPVAVYEEEVLPRTRDAGRRYRSWCHSAMPLEA
jgi:hypothetical protein